MIIFRTIAAISAFTLMSCSQSKIQEAYGAISSGNEIKLEAVISKYGLADLESGLGESFIFTICGPGSPDNPLLVDVLVKHGADVNQVQEGETVLMHAALWMKPKIANRLVHFGAKTDARATDGKLAFELVPGVASNTEARALRDSLQPR